MLTPLRANQDEREPHRVQATIGFVLIRVYYSQALLEILLKLPPSDRIRSTLTCRLWAEIVCSEMMLVDVLLTIRGGEWRTAVPILMRSQRRYKNMRIFRANLHGYGSDVWSKLGRHLCELEIDACWLGPVELHTILENCPALEVLKIRDYSPRGRASPLMLHAFGGFDQDEIRESTRKLRHLLLNYSVTEIELQHIISLVPNFTSLSLSSGTKKDYFLPAPNSPLEDPPYHSLTTSHMLTKLDFFDIQLLDEQVELLIGTYADILEELRLNTNKLTGKAYEIVARCTKLKHLYLPLAHEFKESHLMVLVWNSRNLLTLEISYCEHLTKTCLPYILSLKKLRHLSLLGCQNIGSVGLGSLATISNLEYLNLQDTKIKKEDILCLAELKNLRSLILDAEIDSETFGMICEAFPKLKKLKLLACETLTDEDAAKLQHLKYLDDLHMRIGVGFTDSTFKRPLGAAAMEGLFLDGCPITDLGLAFLVSNHRQLKHLVLSDCLRVTDQGLAFLVANEPMLEKLELFYCDSVRGPFLHILSDACPRLERLVFAECAISELAMRTFRHRRPNVLLHCDD